METARSAVDVMRAIDAAIEETAHLAGSRPVTVVAEYPAHLPAVVADPTVLPKVISGLISLAVLGSEKREVRVRAALSSPEELQASLNEAMAPEETPEVSGPWVQVTVSGGGRIRQARLGNGSGGGRSEALETGFPPGLETSRKIIADLGGHIWIEETSPSATTIHVALPVHGAGGAGLDRSSVRKMVEARLPEGDRSARTLLVVVDSSDLGDLLSNDLTSAGYRVLVADRGREGLALAREVHPDLILLDLTLREPSPLELAMLLKHDRRTRAIPVLFLTVVGDPHKGASVSAASFLVRQPGTGALLTAIHALESSGIDRSARVLVVEPEASVRGGMAMMIQAHGYRVTESEKAVEALALAERLRPALVLVNAQLAQEHDFWLLRNLRQTCGEAGIFVLADGITEADGMAAVRRGASGYSDTDKLKDLLDQVTSNGA